MSRRKKWKDSHPLIKVPTVLQPTPESATVAALIPSVERAAKQAESLQPRFSADPNKFFLSTMRWVSKAETEAPPYASDARLRDQWLQRFVMLEPHLAGILASMASIDSNRGWTLTGGRNQVRRLTRSLHNFRVAQDIVGWRPGVRSMSYQFHGMDLGGMAEIAREGDEGPLAGFYSADPGQCRLTGNGETPLEFFPTLTTKPQFWRASDYMRVTDISYNPERFNGLGWCGVSRALELAKVMIGVLFHDQEQLGSKMPKGLLLLKGITEQQWNTAMDARTERLTQKEREYYGGVEVLASGMEDISANLVALSSLPAGFDLLTFTNLTMYGYALCFGYDAREFWPVHGGALGTATETEVQHRKATQKGAGDFSLAHQEQIQREDVLPETIQFEYQERDVEGAKAEVELNMLHAEFASTLYTAGLLQGAPLISQQQALQLLADANVIPQEWTALEEDVTATDDEAVESQASADQTQADQAGTGAAARARRNRDRLLSNDAIYRAAETFPHDQVVRYQWPRNTVTVLAESGAMLLHRRSWPMLTIKKRDTIPTDLPDYATLRAKFARDVYGAVFGYLDDTGSRVTFYRNLLRGSVQSDMAQAFGRGYLDAGGEETDAEDEAWINTQIITQRTFAGDAFDSLKAIREAGDFSADAEANARSEAWAATLDGIYAEGKLRGDKNKMLTFQRIAGADASKDPCATCSRLEGTRHSAKYWIKRDLVRRNGNEAYECGRWGTCTHEFFTDAGDQYTGAEVRARVSRPGAVVMPRSIDFAASHATGVDMPSLSIIVRQDLAPEAQAADIEHQLTMIREATQARLAAKLAQDNERTQDAAARARRDQLIEDAITTMRDFIQEQIRRDNLPVVPPTIVVQPTPVTVQPPPVNVTVQAPPAPPPAQVNIITPAPIVNFPVRRKQKIDIVRGSDGEASAFEVETEYAPDKP